MHKISTKKAAISHLSDALQMMEYHCQVEARRHIYFVKLLLIKYPNDTLVPEEELNNIWKEVINH
ncbi:MAG: hypothetical protein LIP09_12255 [Bacteroidales bacterium]|nr:hypothetical protein [Bacteroidales bacterium]